METKYFKIEVVLSSIYGILLCKIDEVYKCLDWVFNDASLFTHQLLKAGRQARPFIEKQHPFLKDIFLDDINTENWEDKLNAIKSVRPREILLERIGEYSGGLFSDLAEITDVKSIVVTTK